MEIRNILSKKSQFQIKEIKNIRLNPHNDIFKFIKLIIVIIRLTLLN